MGMNFAPWGPRNKGSTSEHSGTFVLTCLFISLLLFLIWLFYLIIHFCSLHGLLHSAPLIDSSYSSGTTHVKLFLRCTAFAVFGLAFRQHHLQRLLHCRPMKNHVVERRCCNTKVNRFQTGHWRGRGGGQLRHRTKEGAAIRR